jgi:hypothetical protein
MGHPPRRQSDLTVEEGLQELDRICAMHLSVKGGTCLWVPEPSPIAKELLNALDVKLPLMLPKSTVVVDTKKKLVPFIQADWKELL